MIDALAFSIVFAFTVLSVAADFRPCTIDIPVNEMTTKSDGIYNMMDGRQLKGTVHHVGGCQQQNDFPTGNPYKTNYTILSYDSSVSAPECIDKKANDGTGIYDSFQAIIVESNGFTFQPDLFVDDIDALETRNKYQGRLDAWRESSIVFGILNGAIVHPDQSLTNDTLLDRHDFTVPQSAMAEMGLGSFGEINVQGAQFSDTAAPHNCPFAPADVESSCRMKIKFKNPIEKLVILYAATHKANQDPNAVMFVSPLTLPCTCICTEMTRRGVKYLPVEDQPGVCTRKDEAKKKPRYNCDMLATSNVCTYGFIDYLERTGPEDQDGHYPCRDSSAVTVTSHQEYNPVPNFVPPP